jgi:hypothetical protein
MLRAATAAACTTRAQATGRYTASTQCSSPTRKSRMEPCGPNGTRSSASCASTKARFSAAASAIPMRSAPAVDSRSAHEARVKARVVVAAWAVSGCVYGARRRA